MTYNIGDLILILGDKEFPFVDQTTTGIIVDVSEDKFVKISWQDGHPCGKYEIDQIDYFLERGQKEDDRYVEKWIYYPVVK